MGPFPADDHPARVRRWLWSPGFQLLQVKAADYKALVTTTLPTNTDAAAIIESVRAALAFRLFFVPAPRYDTAWADLHRLRHLFCRELPVPALVGQVVEDVSVDVGYLETADVKETTLELTDLRKALRASLDLPDGSQSPDATAARVRLEAMSRVRLEAVSRRVSDAREARWLKVNMKRSRLALMGLLLAAVIVCAAIGLPAVIQHRSHPFFVALVLSGAAGGLVSSLLSPESVNAKATDFYVSRRLLYLRPLVGAAAGLISFFAVRAGVLTVVGIDRNSETAGFVVLAFASGFSERLVVNRVVDPLAGKERSADKPVGGGKGAVA